MVHNVGSTECPEVKKYPKIFYGIGKLKNVQVNLHISEAIPRNATEEFHPMSVKRLQRNYLS